MQGPWSRRRVEDLGQPALGQTPLDDLDCNSLLWALSGLAYQLLHLLRTTGWRTAQPKRIHAWLFRMPGRLCGARALKTVLRPRLYKQSSRVNRTWLFPRTTI